ncbi:MAG: hypothetical protein CVU98_09610 [Firmicutes bacterium HGW-Firmicutes-3]|jgi:MinD-like ATPase involved in chromosome partitioning or flagellar assembly|nr:MAG: hypothetical protein CVU98_09610 [Firmicutes bacterium HGW-Firmicutes-3]
MQIAFWSPNHGQTGTTSAAVAMASMSALMYNFKILLAHSHFERSTLESCFMKEKVHHHEDLLDFSDNGLDALKRLAKNGRLASGMICDYTISLLANRRLDLLQGTKTPKPMDTQETLTLLSQIFTVANGDYDLTMIDVPSGTHQKLTRKIIKHSDLVVVCLNQNKALLDAYFTNPSYASMLSEKTVLYNIGMYNKDSRYTLKNLAKTYGMNNMMCIPYDVGFMDACNNSRVLDFMMRHLTTNSKNKHRKLLEHLERNCERMMKQLEKTKEEASIDYA